MCKDREKSGERKVSEAFFLLLIEIFIHGLSKAKKDVAHPKTSLGSFSCGWYENLFIHHRRRHQKTIGLHPPPFFPLSG